MARRAPRLDGGRCKHGPTRLHNVWPRSVGPQVAAGEDARPTVDFRSRCGLVTAEEVDVYQDEARLGTSNNGPLEQCGPWRGRGDRDDTPDQRSRTPDLRTGGKRADA